jgi:hypothetical protein
VKDRLTLMSSLFFIKYKIKNYIAHILFGHPVDSNPSAVAYSTHLQFYLNIQFNFDHKTLSSVPHFVILGATTPHWVTVSSFTRFLNHIWHTTFGRTPLDEWSARRRDLYLTTNNTPNRIKFMPPAGCEPKISADEPPQTYPLDRAATGTG